MKEAKRFGLPEIDLRPVDYKKVAGRIQSVISTIQELINEWVAALNGGMKLSTIASSVHPYPTLGEINKHVAGSFFSPKVFSETVNPNFVFLKLKLY